MAHETQAQPATHPAAGKDHAGSRLGAFLCWAVVFADIGTSVYYVPGILYGTKGIGTLAGFFVLLTLFVFLLLTFKYAEVSTRFPEGGGVVTVASRAFNPWMGALGGMFILVDYFLTSAISSLSGVLYLQAIIPPLPLQGIPKHLQVLAAPTIFALVLMILAGGTVIARARSSLVRSGLMRMGGRLLAIVVIPLLTVLTAFLFVFLAQRMALGAGSGSISFNDILKTATGKALLFATSFGGLSLGILGGLGLSAQLNRQTTDEADHSQRMGLHRRAVAAVVVIGGAVTAAVAALILYFIKARVLPLSGTAFAALIIIAGIGGLLGTPLGWFGLSTSNKKYELVTVGALGGALGLSIIFGWAFVELITGATLLTLFVVSILGLLNYIGIKESATVSAVAAVAALISDVLILLVIWLHVPPSTIGLVFQAMFTGAHLAPLTMLTGFAGAFLAFSGLESISQLSPVMQIPRKRTVSWALAFVFVTVGVTSPLLTMFSTVLLTDPRFTHTMSTPTYAINPSPDAFISDLAGAYGGQILAVATSVTAAALLVFACNTAIIGAYHVFLALTKMQFFPGILKKRSEKRGTPAVAIVVSTFIPMLTLFAVNGHIEILGDLYAFGLLGAFSLTCLSLDVIRTRERRGSPYVGAEIDPELLGTGDYIKAPAVAGPVPVQRVAPSAVAAAMPVHLTDLGARLAGGWRWLADHLTAPRAAITYYIGFLTTVLVMVAWVTNLFFKPWATLFGGGLTLLGVGVAVFHYQSLVRRGVPPAYLGLPTPMPGSWLVILSPVENQSRKVIQATVQTARGRPLAFLYLAPTLPERRPPRLLEIRDRYGDDEEAQQVLSYAKRESMARQLPAKYLYAVGGAQEVFDVARHVRPDEIVAEEQTAKRVTSALRGEAGFAISPEYVRYQHIDGVTVAHNVLPALYTRASGAWPGTPPQTQQTSPVSGQSGTFSRPSVPGAHDTMISLWRKLWSAGQTPEDSEHQLRRTTMGGKTTSNGAGPSPDPTSTPRDKGEE